MAGNAVSEKIRARKRQIGEAWQAAALSELPQLQDLDGPSLVDHMPEFLDGLAAWVEGDTETATRGFTALVDGHALQRLQNSVDLTTLTREYSLLRSAVLRDVITPLGSLPDRAQLGEAFIRLNEGMDVAIHEAVRRYTHQRDQVRDRFVGILAHDLRNPLGAVTMGAVRVMALAEGPDDKFYRIGTLINRSADRMSRMIHDVIEFARGQLGGLIPIQLQRGDLGEITKDAVDELRAGHPDRTIELQLSRSLDGQWDRDRVMQLVSNLISNAIHHGGDPIIVRVNESSDRHTLTLTVNNRGPVIAAERLSKLFDPLRLETPQQRKGLGLGLYIVRQIALGHGAFCEVHSTEVEGTTFTVTWPRTPVAEVPRPQQ